MTIKRLFILLGISCMGLASNEALAQKVKKEGLGYYNYLKPRLSSALDDATHYYLDIELSNDELYRQKLIEEKININKFEKATVNDDYQFTIKIIESPFKFGRSERKTSTKKVSKNGTESSVSEYYFTGSLGYSYSFIVLDANQEEIYRELIRGSVTAKGRSSTSLSTAQKNYSYDKLAAKDKVVDNFIDRASFLFNQQFTDTEQSISVRIPYVVEKKFSYPNFSKATTLLQEVHASAENSFGLNESQQNQLQEAIQLWETVISELDANDKKAKVNTEVAAAAYFNQGLSYFMQNKYAEAKQAFIKSNELDQVMGSLDNWIKLSGDFEAIIAYRK